VLFEQVLKSLLSPVQLLFTADASVFWQVRDRRWTPVPQVKEQLSQADHCVQPTENNKKMLTHTDPLSQNF